MTRRALKPLLPLLVGLVAVLLGFLAGGTSSAAEAPSRVPPARISTGPATAPPQVDETAGVGNGNGNQSPTRPGASPTDGDCASCVHPPVD
jgi:hypothetical protein